MPDQDLAPTRAMQASALGWILEALERDPSCTHRRIFGCDAAYIEGLLCLVAAARHQPWNGLLVCTSLDRQAALRAEWAALTPHRVLGKWLYLSQEHPEFERIASALIRGVLAHDARIGVPPKPRKRKRKGSARRRPHGD